MKSWIARHDTTVFLILTYGISWPLWFVSGSLSRTPIRAPDSSWLLAQIGVFAPALAGMVVGACLEPGGLRRALRLLGFVYLPAAALGLWIATRGFASFIAVDAASTWGMSALALWILICCSTGCNRLAQWPDSRSDRINTFLWSASCLVAPAALFLAAWAMTGSSAGEASTIPAMPVRDLTPHGVLASFAMNLAYGGSLGEEPGWRGAWLPRLLKHRTPLAASLIISFWWALWHAPIDLSQSFGLAGMGGLAVRQLWTLPVALIFTWVTLRAGGSLIPPLMLHTTINMVPDFVVDQPARYERALGLFFVLLLVVGFVAVSTDSRLRRAPQPQSAGRSL